MGTEPRLRGGILLDQITFIKREHGPAVVSAALRTLSPMVREEIEDALPISWLNVSSVTAFKSAIAAELGEAPIALNRRVVRGSIGETITTVWRLLLSQLWDSAIIKRTPILYSKAFDRGKLTVQTMTDGRAELHLAGWPDMPDYDCAGLARN